MARSSGKGKKSKKGSKPKQGEKSKEGTKPQRDDAGWRSRHTPVKTPVHESAPMKEVTATRAFLTSFVLFSLILGPVLGIGVYFGRTVDVVTSVFPSKEAAFMGGMAFGILVAFFVSIVFTRKAVAQS